MLKLSGPVSVRLKPADAEMLRQLAQARGSTPGDALRDIIRQEYEKTLPKLKTAMGLGWDLLAIAKGTERAAKAAVSRQGRRKTGPKRKSVSGAAAPKAKRSAKAATGKSKTKKKPKPPRQAPGKKLSRKQRRSPPLPKRKSDQ